jgi:hypothetical protein
MPFKFGRPPDEAGTIENATYWVTNFANGIREMAVR